MKIILQKFIAQTGYCSRRTAEKLISLEQSVYVNGEVAQMGMLVDENDDVHIGKAVISNKKKKVYIKLNKPAGYTSTSATFKSDKNVYELLPDNVKTDKSLHIVGRLDKESCGLILFTNDGAITQSLTHPSFEHEKKYIVTLKNKQARDINTIIKKFTEGIHIDDIGMARAKEVKTLGKNKFEITLTEGKKRQIRKMFAYMHEGIQTLQRVSIASLKLGNMKEGEWKYLTSQEIQRLKGK